MNIRQYTTKDLNALAQLFDRYRQFYKQPPDLLLAKTFLTERYNNQESVIFVAEHTGKLVGFCQIYPSFCSVAAVKIGVLYDLFVDENVRKTGAGSQLMLATHDYARASGMARLELTTAKDNLAAQGLYESLGWVRDEVFYAYSKAF